MDEEPTSPEGTNRRAAQDEILVEAIAAGLSYHQAGELADKTARTVARRMTDPAFARKVSERRGARVALVTGQLANLAEEAVSVLRDCLHAERPADRLRAAQVVLSMGLRYHHDADLEVRLAELERLGWGVAAAHEPEQEPAP